MEERSGLLPRNLESRDEGWEGQVLCLSPAALPSYPAPITSVPCPTFQVIQFSTWGGCGGVVIPKSQRPTSTSVTTTPTATRGLSQ